MSLLAIALISSSFAPMDRGYSTTYGSTVAGKQYLVTVTQRALEKAPVWKDDAENPPLSARKAIRLADQLKSKLADDTDKWKWDRETASLVEWVPGRWYWLVSYEGRPTDGIASGNMPRVQLVVLMDGTVVEPKEVAR